MACRQWSAYTWKVHSGSSPEFDIWQGRVDFHDNQTPTMWLSNATMTKAEADSWVVAAKKILEAGGTVPPTSPLGSVVQPEGAPWSADYGPCKGLMNAFTMDTVVYIVAPAAIGAVVVRKNPVSGLLVGALIGAAAAVVMGKIQLPSLTLPGSPSTSTAALSTSAIAALPPAEDYSGGLRQTWVSSPYSLPTGA